MKEYTFHRFSFLDREYEYGLVFSLCNPYTGYEIYLAPMHDWCRNNFGRERVFVAGTHFHFKNREDINWFMLRWS